MQKCKVCAAGGKNGPGREQKNLRKIDQVFSLMIVVVS